jgi:Gpi18-like mannosyltransferase
MKAPSIRRSVLVQSRRPITWAAALCLLAALMVSNLWWAKPYFNWDLIGYIGTSHSFTSSDVERIHQATFADIARNVPTDDYTALASGSDYRLAIAADAELFAQQLPFYANKPVYPALMLVMSKLGYTLTGASVVISQVGYCLIVILVFVWLSRHYAPLPAFVVASLVVSTPFVLDLARYSTPDALSTLVILLACFVFTEAKRPTLTATVFVLSVLVRPDTALLAIVFPLVMWRSKRMALFACVAAIGTTLLLTLLVSTYFGSYSWHTLVHHGFVERLEEPATTEVAIGILEYLSILAGGSHPVSMRGLSYSFLLFLVLGFVVLRLTLINLSKSAARFQMLTAMMIFVVGRWLVFPGEAERTLASFYVVVLLLLLIEAEHLQTVRPAVGGQTDRA